MITAHSGSDGFSDNSVEFVLAMLAEGVSAFEIDCQAGPDGLYLSHDALVNPAAAVQLVEVFQLMKQHRGHNTLINVDCKAGVNGVEVLTLARACGVYERVILSGTLTLGDYSRPERMQLFYNLDNVIDDWPLSTEALTQVFRELKLAGLEVVQLYYGLVNQEIVDLLTANGLKLSVWTPDAFDEIDYLLEIGCYNVTTRRAIAYRQR